MCIYNQGAIHYITSNPIQNIHSAVQINSLLDSGSILNEFDNYGPTIHVQYMQSVLNTLQLLFGPLTGSFSIAVAAKVHWYHNINSHTKLKIEVKIIKTDNYNKNL